MATGTALVEGQFRELVQAPAQVILQAREAAKVLQDVVSRKPKPVMINGEQYLEFEDWQTVARFYGLSVKTHDAQPVDVWGVKGFKAQADVIDNRTGYVVGGAEAYCMTDEENWTTKPMFQVASMAQTRAGSKAQSNMLRWVVVLAGYRGTPAEEMTGKERTSGANAGDDGKSGEASRYYCKEHKMLWFKRGKMTSYGHKVEGTDIWCHMPKETLTNVDHETGEVKELPKVPPLTATVTPAVPVTGAPTVAKETAAGSIDLAASWHTFLAKCRAKKLTDQQIVNACGKRGIEVAADMNQVPVLTVDQLTELNDAVSRTR